MTVLRMFVQCWPGSISVHTPQCQPILVRADLLTKRPERRSILIILLCSKDYTTLCNNSGRNESQRICQIDILLVSWSHVSAYPSLLKDIILMTVFDTLLAPVMPIL